MYARLNHGVFTEAQEEVESMGGNAERKLNLVTVLQVIVGLLFGFSVYVLRDWKETAEVRFKHLEAQAVSGQLAREADIKPRLMIVEQGVNNQQKQLDKMNDKLDKILERVK